MATVTTRLPWWPVLALVLAAAALTLSEEPKKSPLPFRLPGDVVPRNYTLKVVTHFQDDSFRFYGQMLVDVDVLRDTAELRLHAKQLKVDHKSVTVVKLVKQKKKPVVISQPDDDEDSNDIPAQVATQQKPQGVPQKQPQQEEKPQDKPQEKPHEKPQEEPEEELQQEEKPQEKPQEPQQEDKPQDNPQQEIEQEKPLPLPQSEPQSEPQQEPQQAPQQAPQQESQEESQEKPEEVSQETEKEPLVAESQKEPQQDKPLEEATTSQEQEKEPEPQQDENKDEPQQHEEGQDIEHKHSQKTQQAASEEEDVKQDETSTEDAKHQDEEKPEDAKQGEAAEGRSGQGEHAATDASYKGLRLTNVTTDPALEQLVVSLSRPLRAGQRYRLALRYWDTLNTEDRGYFRGSYQYKNQTRWVSSTVFEPAEARRAFPCFDEPHMKANFTVSLGRHANYSSSSNMPLDRTEPMADTPGWFWDHYPPTPKMSTYLVAFMVHDLEASKVVNNASDGALGAVRAWTTPGRSHLANFSLYVAPQVLALLSERLGASPVLPKHDLVAVPGFRSEALENWGLVSFEERHLLLPASASQLSKQSVATVVAHELAHVWFGNLLTPAWWKHIWLSEGFATYYSAEVLEKVFPAWRFHETAAGNAYLLVTSTDASPGALPVLHPADNPHKLDAVFGATSYYKGYWVLRMLRGVLGKDMFDAGVRRYVQRHMHASVRTQDLWEAMQGAVDERAVEDQQAAASQVPGSDAVVVGDGSDEEDEARVVVPESATAAPIAAAAATPAQRPRRDTDLSSPGSLMLQIVDPSYKDHQDVKSPAEAPEGEKAAADENVQSPPRRSPAATAVSGKVGWLPRPLEEVMKNWLQRPGYPIVNVYRNLETGVVTLSQTRFVTGDAGRACDAAAATWWVPVRYATSKTAVADSVFWMPPTCGNVTLPVRVARDDWVLLNAGLSGLYRVRYDARTLQQLSRLPRAAWLQVAPLTRVQLVADAMDLARQGRAPYQAVLRLANHLARDPNPMVWRAALPHLLMLQRQLRGRRDGVALRSWLQDLVSPHTSIIGFTNRVQDSPQQASLRVKVTTLACHADHSACQRKAKKALKLFMGGDPEAIVPGRLTQTQLCAAVRWGGPAEWRFLRSQLSNPSSALPRKAVAAALGCSRDQEKLRSLLADTVNANSTLRRSDVAVVLAAVAANEVGSDITLRFMEEQAAELYKRLGGHPAKVEKAVREVASLLSSKRQLDKLDTVLRQFQSHTPTRSPPTWGRDLVRDNIRWSERSRVEVSRWLRARLDDDDLELRGAAKKKPAVGKHPVAAAKPGTKAATKAPTKAATKAPARAPPTGAKTDKVSASSKPASPKPTTLKPAAAKPGVQKTATARPASHKTATQRPAVQKPVTQTTTSTPSKRQRNLDGFQEGNEIITRLMDYPTVY